MTLFSGTVSAVITYFLNTQKTERELQREKLEELYIDMTKLVGSVVVFYSLYFPILRGEITQQQLVNIQDKNKNEMPEVPAKIQMFVALYFPEFEPAYSQLLEARDELGKFLPMFQSKNLSKDQRQIGIDKLTIGLEKVFFAEKRLNQLLLSKAESLNISQWKRSKIWLNSKFLRR